MGDEKCTSIICPAVLYAPGTMLDGKQVDIQLCGKHSVDTQVVRVEDKAGVVHFFQGTNRIVNDQYIFERFTPEEDFG